ncbi:predicted protein [Plenodomus lingam JN3]|uniref:Predicted protein n=1 Tax=Leptosphaeria maculans (strain JN3 / isolate v23.1.3 / race Av1-4-5-6-7-8) TaxID=985895 RepID=E4ZVM1_LEPMJ|nr:predicted protein [Plenodomus lingam JN3]CBX95647.1 predicted protein [Plenodomus lingam JN3]
MPETEKASSIPDSEQPSMRLAEILSDLVSLRVCDPAAALALVSARPGDVQHSTTTTASTNGDAKEKNDDDDVDIKRAKELEERIGREKKVLCERGKRRRRILEIRKHVMIMAAVYGQMFGGMTCWLNEDKLAAAT